MKSIIFLTSTLLSFTNALPSLPSESLQRRHAGDSSEYQDLVARFAAAQDSPAVAGTGVGGAPSCDISGAKLPQAPVPLPPVSEGLVLAHVVIGRGTQNYTCADNTANTKPVAVGAVATLYNATCMAAPYPQLVSSMPAISLKFPVPDTQQLKTADTYLSGHHWFPNATTPVFDMNTGRNKWGTGFFKKEADAKAPNPSKDVPWLKLTATRADGCTLTEVYRVDTAGGVAPATCAGQPKEIQVQYATAYWMYAKPANQGYGTPDAAQLPPKTS